MILGQVLIFLAGGVLVCYGQSECQCGGFIVKDEYSEWFYSFLTFFHEDCNGLDACKSDCYDFVSNITNNGDLTTIVPGEDISFGDFICKTVNHEVETNSSIEFEYQLCDSPWYDTGMVSTFPFCCINGDFPESGCPTS